MPIDALILAASMAAIVAWHADGASKPGSPLIEPRRGRDRQRPLMTPSLLQLSHETDRRLDTVAHLHLGPRTGLSGSPCATVAGRRKLSAVLFS